MKTFLLAMTMAMLALSGTARASATETDNSDLWWNASESGWGLQLSHRGGVIFATMYAYDAQGKPTWSTAVLRKSGDQWQGDLYLTTGPYYATTPFDAASVTRRVAGTMTWSTADAYAGKISYTVDGITVSKQVERQALENENYAGKYMGALSWVNTCTGQHENFVDLTVTQVGANVSVNWVNQATRDSCSFSGVLGQAGQLGLVNGTFQCGPVHDDGEFTFYDLRVAPESISGRYESSDEDTRCRSSGRLAAVRKR